MDVQMPDVDGLEATRVRLMEHALRHRGPDSAGIWQSPSGHATLEAELHVVPDARALILIASARGYSRHDPRHEPVTVRLERAQFATLVPDLLTAAEEILDQPMNSGMVKVLS